MKVLSDVAFAVNGQTTLMELLHMTDRVDELLANIREYSHEDQDQIMAVAQRLNALMARVERQYTAREN